MNSSIVKTWKELILFKNKFNVLRLKKEPRLKDKLHLKSIKELDALVRK
jgi:hypothetical protein